MSYGRDRRLPGFTLVELLVVIGIIALLLAMLMPALNKIRQASQALECGTQLRQIGQATKLYACDYRGARPVAAYPGSYSTNRIRDFDMTNPSIAYRLHSGLLVDPYLANRLDVLFCKGADKNTLDSAKSRFFTTAAYDVSINYLQRVVLTGAYIREGQGTRQAVMYDWYAWYTDPMMATFNNRNHRDGANVLYSDGSVTWYRVPSQYWDDTTPVTWLKFDAGNLQLPTQ